MSLQDIARNLIYGQKTRQPIVKSPVDDLPSPEVNTNRTQMALEILKSLAGPAFTALSPLEGMVDSAIRKGSPAEKAQSLLQTGPDIGGALQTRGVPGAVAFPVGLAASVAIPGAGEVGVAKNSLSKLSKIHPEDVGALDWAADIIKRKGLDQEIYDQAAAIIGRLSDGYGVVADTTTQAARKLQKLAGDIVGKDYTPDLTKSERFMRTLDEASSPLGGKVGGI